jgi:Cyclin, C-terminal domain
LECSAVSEVSALPEDAEHFALYMLELSLQDSPMLEFCPSVRAATACFLAIKTFSESSWSPTLRYYSGNLSEEDLVACETAMLRLLGAEQLYQGTNKLTAVKRKFAQPKFNEISRRAMLIDLKALECGARGIRGAEKSPEFPCMDICYEGMPVDQRH